MKNFLSAVLEQSGPCQKNCCFQVLWRVTCWLPCYLPFSARRFTISWTSFFNEYEPVLYHTPIYPERPEADHHPAPVTQENFQETQYLGLSLKLEGSILE